MIYQDYEARMRAVPYPNRDEIKKAVMVGMDEFVGTRAQIEAEEARRQEEIEDLYRRGRSEHATQQNEILKTFAEGLAKEYGMGHEAVDAKVYSMAWEAGHSGGLSEVENHYMDYADLAEFAFAAGQRAGE
jgi:hypothetical protein